MSNSLFVAPHPDDESLWGAYIIMSYDCDVAIFVDDKTPEQTKAECVEACKILGVKNFSFIRDIKECSVDYQNVFIPAPEGGHKWHDAVCKICESYFKDWALKYYMSYGPDKNKAPVGRLQVVANQVMLGKKLDALACYKSQQAKASVHFNLASKDEWLF